MTKASIFYQRQIEECQNEIQNGKFEKVLILFEKLIEAGHYEICVNVGKMYEKGNNQIPKNFNKAKYYYEMAVEKESSVEALLCLARLYYYGFGVSIDYKKSFEFYKKISDEKNIGFAHFMLGKMYYFGQYVKVDYNQAKIYLEKGWQQGHIYSLNFLCATELRLGNFFKGMWYFFKAHYCLLLLMLKDKKYKINPKTRKS